MKQPELGQKLADLRKSKGLTQEELVDLCNISVRTIQRIETGEVTPRSYTVKTILSALDAELEKFTGSEKETSVSSHSRLKWAWIAGIFYFILGFPESFMDMGRMSDSIFNAYQYSQEVSWGGGFYIFAKILVVISFSIFIRGFIIIGSKKNSVLKIISIILGSIMILSVGHDIVSIFYDTQGLSILLVTAVTFGTVGIIFGIALIYLRKDFGDVCLFAGILEIIAGLMIMTMNPFGLVIQMPAEILEVIILYKAAQYFGVADSP